MVINIGLIDYGMGNLHSVEKSFNRLNQTIRIVKKPKDLKYCQALILPGVGAFDPAIENLQRTKLIPELKEWAISKKPLLGICLGLQLLFESSEEGKLKGLGILEGTINHLPRGEKNRIPHIGWAKLNKHKECPLFRVNDNCQWMYFVHSYSAITSNNNDLAASVDFGDKKLTAIIWKDNIAACQFHPEKSGKSGEVLLRRWLTWLQDEAKLKN